jgi:putative SOS response-associated peptidase YedK
MWNWKTDLPVRMPVILRPEEEEEWLDASRTSFAKARSLLQPLPEELMEATTFRQSSTRQSTTGRNAFDLFQMTTYLAPASCPCCKQY